MSARDELALELFIGDNGNQSREQSIEDWHWLNEHAHLRGRTEHYGVMAAHILATGYRKPRTITTVEELDALPGGSLILDALNYCREAAKLKDGNVWRSMGPASVRSSGQLPLPVTVLHEPGPDQ
jgi:hypothetical protein